MEVGWSLARPIDVLTTSSELGTGTGTTRDSWDGSNCMCKTKVWLEPPGTYSETKALGAL